jgi:hypothetical protein
MKRELPVVLTQKAGGFLGVAVEDHIDLVVQLATFDFAEIAEERSPWSDYPLSSERSTATAS